MTELYWRWIATLDPAAALLTLGMIAWLLGCWFFPHREPKRPEAYQWNAPEHLPPVRCPLVLNLGPEYGWDIAYGERISHLRDRRGLMEYELSTGQIITGRFPWSYP